MNQQELLSESMTLYPNKIKWVLVLLGCIIFIAMGIFLIGDHDTETLLGLFSCMLGGLGISISILTLWPNSSWLKLGPDGMRERVLFRKFHYNWSEVTRFATTVVRHRSGAHRTETKFVSFWMKCDDDMRSLSECYGKKAEELMKILESYRDRHG